MNVFTFTGNLGRDVVIRDAAGTPVSSLAVAVKSGFGERAQTLWVDCSWFGQRATGRIADYLKKGTQVCVSGELGTREYNGKTYLTCRVSELTLIGGRDNATPAPSQSKQQPRPPAATQYGLDDLDDDVPF